jgi:hypothetical protein
MNNDGLELIKQTVAALRASATPPSPQDKTTEPSRIQLILRGGGTPESVHEIARLESALADLTSDIGRGHGSFFTQDGQPEADYWLAALWAIAGLGWARGEEIARNWSQQCAARYTDEGFDKAWRSYKPNHPTPVGIGSLYKRAMQLGRQSKEPAAPNTQCYRQLSLLEQVDQTDAGNAALLYNLSDDELKYIHERKCWIVWSSDRWQIDTGNALAHQRMLEVSIYHQDKSKELMKQADDSAFSADQAKSLRKAGLGSLRWSLQCRNKNRLDAMLALAQRDPRFLLKSSQLDSNPWLIGVINGVVDIRTGTLKPDGKADYVLKRCPVRFDPNAVASKWIEFIEEITSTPGSIVNGKVEGTPRPKLADYLQKALGYSMTGMVNEHVMFIAIGQGSNGKNVLLDTYKEICGDYCETILSTSTNADVAGARFDQVGRGTVEDLPQRA